MLLHLVQSLGPFPGIGSINIKKEDVAAGFTNAREIIRVPDINREIGYRQVARLCDHKPITPVRDGKLAAAGKDS